MHDRPTTLRRAARGAPWWLAVITALLLVAAAPARAEAPQDLNGIDGYVGGEGRWFTDDEGRVLFFRGFVWPYKREPWLIDAAGVGEDDAQFVADEGFNLMQVRFTYQGLEPEPGRYDGAYMDRVVGLVKQLTSRGVRVFIQANQGGWGPEVGGHGFPPWATYTGGRPNPDVPFGFNYILNPALNKAFDNFWANRTSPRGDGLQDGFAEAVAELGRRLADDPLFLGVDVLNEPWLGSVWPTCFPVGRVNPAGCRKFDRTKLKPFYERFIDTVRPAMPRQMILYEPTPTFDLGIPTGLDDIGGGDGNVGFAFHAYCALDGGGADLKPLPFERLKTRFCTKEEEHIMDYAHEHATSQGVPMLSSEFGATPLAGTTARLMALHERRLVPWTYAAYCCRDASQEASGDVILDPKQPPTEDNLDQEKLRVLVRPYPAALAGVPTKMAFDPASRGYELRFTTARPGGGAYDAGTESVVQVPGRQYPDGYRVTELVGARVVSEPGAEQLRLVTEDGVQEVSLKIGPASDA